MFHLPAANHPTREALGDIAHVAELLAPANAGKLPDFAEAVRAGRRTIEANPAASRVNIICMRANDERWLISVGKRGGWRKLWNFGTGR